MALYVYDVLTGELVSWCPNDTDPVASDTYLAANNLAVVTGLPALDSTHVWDVATKTILTVADTTPKLMPTGTWILRFTPQEFQAIMASTDATVQQFIYALNHTTMINLHDPIMVNCVNYLASLNLLTQARVSVVME